MLANTDARDGAESVLSVHRQRNRAPRLPSTSQLAVVRLRQHSASAHTMDQIPSVGLQEIPCQPDDTEFRPPSLVLQSQTGRSRAHVATEGMDPSQLQFYEPAVRDIIERAKQFSHCDAASINAFPLRVEFNKRAQEYMEEAIMERRSRLLIIPDGKQRRVGFSRN